MQNDYLINISQMSLVDKILSVLKAGVSVFSEAAPLVSLLSDYQSQKQTKLIEDVLNRFLSMIEELDNRVKDLEYMNSQDFIYDLLQTVDRAKDEQDEYRRFMYAKYLTSCCHIENVKNRCKRIFLDYMGKMDELDYFVLKSLNNTFNDRNAIDDVTHRFNHENHCDLSKREVMNHFYYLTSLGIIEMSDQEEVVKFRKRYQVESKSSTFRKERLYQRTTLGDDLYYFIRRAEEKIESDSDGQAR